MLLSWWNRRVFSLILLVLIYWFVWGANELHNLLARKDSNQSNRQTDEQMDWKSFVEKKNRETTITKKTFTHSISDSTVDLLQVEWSEKVIDEIMRSNIVFQSTVFVHKYLAATSKVCCLKSEKRFGSREKKNTHTQNNNNDRNTGKMFALRSNTGKEKQRE